MLSKKCHCSAALLQRLTGLNVKEFESLLEAFSTPYSQQVIQPRVNALGRQRAAGGGQKGALPEMVDKLLFILVYTRIYPLLFVQGLFFGMAESKACTWVGVLLSLPDTFFTGKRGENRPVRPVGKV